MCKFIKENLTKISNGSTMKKLYLVEITFFMLFIVISTIMISNNQYDVSNSVVDTVNIVESTIMTESTTSPFNESIVKPLTKQNTTTVCATTATTTHADVTTVKTVIPVIDEKIYEDIVEYVSNNVTDDYFNNTVIANHVATHANTEIIVSTEPSKPIETTTQTMTTTITTPTETNAVDEFIVYKPSTHYVHKNTCHWYNEECIKIDNTNDIQSRKCSECNPDIEIVNKYVETPIKQENVNNNNNNNNSMTFLKTFKRGTYYSGAYYSSNPSNVKGGSGRVLIDGTIGDGTGIKGSIASNYIQRNYGYNRNGGRTLVYIECKQYPSLNGKYYLDDSQGYNNEIIDFFYYYNSNCPFQRQGVVSVDAWLIN